MDEITIRTDKFYVSKLFPIRMPNSNKGTYGTVLNFAGSIYYSGAAYLSSMAAMRAGAGLVRLASETGVINTIASMAPDITFVDLGQNGLGTIPKNAIKYLKNLKIPSSVIIGPGLTTLPPVKDFVIKYLSSNQDCTTPIIIDADAINILSSIEDKPFPLNSVITPHPVELSRLIGVEADVIQSNRVKWAKYTSAKFDCIVVLKGMETVISIPNGNTFINPTGNSSLSHAGTGDVLAGMIAGFAAQGLKLENACVLACYLHGRAGEVAGKKLSEYSVLASDLLNYIPVVMKEFV